MGWLIELLPLSYPDAVVVCGAVAIGLAAGVLGALAVVRERSLVGDALAHSALPGICVAFLVTGVKDATGLLAGAALAGLIGAVVIVLIERTSRIRPDAAIGVVLSSFFSLGIVLLTFIGHQDNANQAGLETYLFGQAAGLLERDVEVMMLVSLGSIGLVALAFRPLKATLFDPAFAGSAGLPVRLVEIASTALLVVAVVIGIRAVGAVLMVAMLVVPTAAARQFTSRLSVMLAFAGLVGAVVGVVGALLSGAAEVPTGPVIVLVGVLVVLGAVLAAPGRGVLWRARRLSRDRDRLAREAILLDLRAARVAEEPLTVAVLAQASGRARRTVDRAIRSLVRDGSVVREGDRVSLTDRGAAAADRLADDRRLWSAWLEHGWQIPLALASDPDPRALRATLGADALADLESLAGSAR